MSTKALILSISAIVFCASIAIGGVILAQNPDIFIKSVNSINITDLYELEKLVDSGEYHQALIQVRDMKGQTDGRD